MLDRRRALKSGSNNRSRFLFTMEHKEQFPLILNVSNNASKTYGHLHGNMSTGALVSMTEMVPMETFYPVFVKVYLMSASHDDGDGGVEEHGC